MVWHYQSIGGLQEPHHGAVQNGGTKETLFVHTPQHWSSTGIHHHPGLGAEDGIVCVQLGLNQKVLLIIVCLSLVETTLMHWILETKSIQHPYCSGPMSALNIR